MRHKSGAIATDCTAIPGESFLTQHRAVRAKIKITGYSRQKRPLRRRLKTWKLMNEETRQRFEETFIRMMGSESRSWGKVQGSMMAAAEQVCGWTTGRRGRERQTWWWDDDVKEVIKQKKRAYKLWQRSRLATDKETYLTWKREARRCVSEAKKRAWTEWSENLRTTDGRNKMFRVASQMKKDKTDEIGRHFIKNDQGAIVVEGEGVRNVWKGYFETLLNEENPNEFEEEPPVEGPIEDIDEEEVRAAIQSMKSRKAAGPSGVTTDLIKFGGESATKELHQIFQRRECPVEWTESLTVAIYKGKGAPLECGKHRGLR